VAGVVAPELFPPNSANRFYEEDGQDNRVKFQRIQTGVKWLTGTLAVGLIAALILKNGGSRADWVKFAARNFTPCLITTTAIFALGFWYTQKNLNALATGPKLDTSNSLTKVQVTQFLSRMADVEKIKLLDTKEVTAWKEALKGYLDRNGDCLYLGPKERARVKKILTDFIALEAKLQDTTKTKVEISDLLKKVQTCMREHRFAIENRKRPLVGTDQKISEDLQRLIDSLNSRAEAPEIIEIKDQWYQTLIFLESSLTSLLKKIENEQPTAQIHLNEEVIRLRKQFNDSLQQHKDLLAKRDRVRAIIIRLLQGENVEPDDRLTDALLKEWKSFASSAVQGAKTAEELQQRILKLSYSFLQDI